MATATKERPETQNTPKPAPGEKLPALHGPRLPFHPLIEQRFGVDRASWKALCEAIFPNATTVESIVLALSYCKARKLDVFKRNVHIVPIWNKQLGCMIDTIWPGIGELRTTAFRTGEYAGRSRTEYGPTLTQKVGSADLTFPEWAQVTVYRMVKGQRVEFAGPQVYWLETYATVKRNDDTPNEMWLTRPMGQIDKCAEAGALRAAFPEEVGGEYIPEEVQHTSKVVDGTVNNGAQTLDDLAERLSGPAAPSLAPGELTAEEAAALEREEGEKNSPTPAEQFAACTTKEAVIDLHLKLCEAAASNEEAAGYDALRDAAYERLSGKSAKSQKELASK